MTHGELELDHHLLCIDEGRQRLLRVDTRNPDSGWILDLGELPLARDMQAIGGNAALIGFDRGFFEIDIETGEIGRICDRWTRVSSARRLADGSTLVVGVDLEGRRGVTLLRLDPALRLVDRITREGDYVRLMRPTGTGSFLLATNDRILETDDELATLREFRAEGFYHAWLAERLGDGSTLVSAGYGAFMARFDPSGSLLSRFGKKKELPPEFCPNFYASFQVLGTGRILVANWQGHGPDNGDRGRQLLEFDSEGQLMGSWSDPRRISSLQGILVLS